MKIDRHLFLVLTGTLAAIACGADPVPPPITPVVDPTPPPVVSADPTPPLPPPAVEASTPPTPPAPPPPPKPDPKTIANNDDIGCGTTNRKFNDAKTKCSDDKGGAVSCKAVAVGYSAKEGCQDGPDLIASCESYKKGLKPRIAAQAFACMARTPAKDKCQSCSFDTCAWDALMDACPDPTADADCKEIAGRCQDFDTAKCRAYLSGMTAQGRAGMKTCMMKDCRTGLLACSHQGSD